jgi:4-aminobutyrate aminotransferase
VLETEGDIAAVIAEPIRWTPCVTRIEPHAMSHRRIVGRRHRYIPKKEYWERVRAACDKHGAC